MEGTTEYITRGLTIAQHVDAPRTTIICHRNARKSPSTPTTTTMPRERIRWEAPLRDSISSCTSQTTDKRPALVEEVVEIIAGIDSVAEEHVDVDAEATSSSSNSEWASLDR